ncbi:MAG TPA: hypothetical protein P5349_11680 [Tenuifilaceae bacterium]|nr:hypothetical protein [Tenuifilaceae bacterium]
MKSTNRINNSFGPVGSFSGKIIFIAGIIVCFSSLYGLIIAIFGAFVGFTCATTTVDFEKKRVRFSNNIFGIIPTGSWLNLEPTMKLGVEKVTKAWRTYSQSNRTADISDNVIRITLFSSENKPLFPIKNFKTKDDALTELDILCNELGLQKA